MTGGVCHRGHLLLAAFIAAMALAHAAAADADPVDVKDLAADRAERKRAAADGKPLPGTPDLTKLDQRLAEKNVAPGASIYLRLFKAESELEVWTGDDNGRYSLFATYPICYWSGTLGPKIKEGDRQAPEGFYAVDLSQTHHSGRWPQSLDIGFPNPFDQVNQRDGFSILIHGGCASIGCYAMTNAVNLEVHKLTVDALEAGQVYVPVHIFPFRMTAENLARYETSPWRDFWSNLKEGYDIFEHGHRPPRVSVCGGHYEFEPTGRLEGANPGPILVCPETAQVLADLANLNSRAAEPTPEPTEMKVASLGAPISYLGGPPPPAAGLSKLGPNFAMQVTPAVARAGVSKVLTRPLACSLALPSCRRYAALREQMVHKATLRLEEPEPKPHVERSRKRKQSSYRHRRYSEDAGEYRQYREERVYSRYE